MRWIRVLRVFTGITYLAPYIMIGWYIFGNNSAIFEPLRRQWFPEHLTLENIPLFIFFYFVNIFAIFVGLLAIINKLGTFPTIPLIEFGCGVIYVIFLYIKDPSHQIPASLASFFQTRFLLVLSFWFERNLAIYDSIWGKSYAKKNKNNH